MSRRKLNKTTFSQDYPDNLGIVAKMAEEALEAVFDEYGEEEKCDIRGSVEVTAVLGRELTHLATYSLGPAIDHSGWYDYIYVYCPNGFRQCGIRILAEIVDANCVGYGRITREFIRKVAKKINERIKAYEQCDNSYLCTLDALVRDEPTSFTLASVYVEAEEIGIIDYRLVDMTIQNLLLDGVLAVEGNGYRTVDPYISVG